MPESVKRVRFHPLFEVDVIEAAEWYDVRSTGLGDAVDSIVAEPMSFARTPLGLRFARVRRFPYLVLFDLTDDRLLVLGVLHGARSMKRWRSRRG